MKYILFISLFFGSCFFLQAQSIIPVHGMVVYGSNPLPQINVYNQSTLVGTVTNYKGEFELLAHPGDTISFSSIGYKSNTYYVPDSISEHGHRLLVNMMPDTVLLRETVIMPWPAKSMLKQAFLDHKEEKEPISVFAGFREIEGDPVEPSPTILNPFSLLSEKIGKKARHKRKMKKYRDMLNEDVFFFEAEE